jgi:hypothetical protein
MSPSSMKMLARDSAAFTNPGVTAPSSPAAASPSSSDFDAFDFQAPILSAPGRSDSSSCRLSCTSRHSATPARWSTSARPAESAGTPSIRATILSGSPLSEAACTSTPTASAATASFG